MKFWFSLFVLTLAEISLVYTQKGVYLVYNGDEAIKCHGANGWKSVGSKEIGIPLVGIDLGILPCPQEKCFGVFGGTDDKLLLSIAFVTHILE